jgi:geranylgeranyl reductase family protein
VTRQCDVLIVGGGPAGSSCAWALRRAGRDVIVMDRAQFPRDKLCAGWITPPVLRLLDLDPAAYGSAGLTIQPIRGFRTGIVDGRTVDTEYDHVVSYAIRRCEFDNYLLMRSGARLLTSTPLRSLRRERDGWIVNDEIEARVVIGAGGHFCPVARFAGRDNVESGLVVAQEAEMLLPDPDACSVSGTLPELYFCEDLEGYGWCVRKGAYLNVGLGRRDGNTFPAHVRSFTEWLEKTRGVPTVATRTRWRGHAYLLAGSVKTPLVDDGLMLIGDAAGLAYPESGEGIRTAVNSGLQAAQALVNARDHRRESLFPYEQAIRSQEPSGNALTSFVPRGVIRSLGRWLLGNATFTRRVVLDRWFLHTAAASPDTLRRAA